MCNKINHRIECVKCGYPYSEAMYPDRDDSPLPCDTNSNDLQQYIANYNSKVSDKWRNSGTIEKKLIRYLDRYWRNPR